MISEYKAYRNKLIKIKELAKKRYYYDQLNKHKNNISHQRKLINEIRCHKKKKGQVINVITESDGNIKITNKYHISNLCNNYFTSVGPKWMLKYLTQI